MPALTQPPYSFTAVGLGLIVLQTGIVFAPFAGGAAHARSGVEYLGASLSDVAAACADIWDAWTHRISWAEVLPLAAPNAAGLAGGVTVLISALLLCEQTPPRGLGVLAVLLLCASAAPLHPYAPEAETLLAGGFLWFGICGASILACLVAPRANVHGRRKGALISFRRRAVEPPAPMLGMRTARVLIRN